MGYISNKGILAGPIQLNGNTKNDNDVLWLKSVYRDDYDEMKEVVLQVYNSDMQNFAPIYASMPLNVTDWTKEDNAVATVGWVRTNFSSSTGINGFNPDDYVKITIFNDLKKQVNNNSNRIDSLEKTALQINPLIQKVDTLDRDFKTYKENPYPNGVIFIAGTAAEVV